MSRDLPSAKQQQILVVTGVWMSSAILLLACTALPYQWHAARHQEATGVQVTLLFRQVLSCDSADTVHIVLFSNFVYLFK
jgi:hypothetical protein